jgi:hypothetical protein
MNYSVNLADLQSFLTTNLVPTEVVKGRRQAGSKAVVARNPGVVDLATGMPVQPLGSKPRKPTKQNLALESDYNWPMVIFYFLFILLLFFQILYFFCYAEFLKTLVMHFLWNVNSLILISVQKIDLNVLKASY